MEPQVHNIHEPVTGTWQYIVADPETKEAAIIDAVLDYNRDTGVLETASANKILGIVDEHDYRVCYILETHAHADHLTASRYLQSTLVERGQDKPPVCIGQRIQEVQKNMGGIYEIPEAEMRNAFDRLFADDSTFRIGSLEARVVPLPGHTPDHIGYIVGRNIFTGDSMFNADVGSARCDFPGGSATALYASMQKLLSFPKDYKLYTGHDYPPKDRTADDGSGPFAVPYTTVEEQSMSNKHVKTGTKLEEFVQWRTERDSTLGEPKLLLQSMHVNVRGGRLPARAVAQFKIDSIPANVPVAEGVV